MSGRSPRPPRRRQHGLAALAVVLLLFFVVSLVAAYTSRNLIFEQRTGVNQYRSTQAMETAEAGLEWALLKLNGGRIDADCEPSTDTSDTSFRERYLVTNADTGFIGARVDGSGNVAFATCVRDGENWSCRCPASGITLPDAPTTEGPHPAFRVAIIGSTARPGMVRIYANGCTRLVEDCLTFSPNMSALPIVRAVAPSGEGFAAISTWAGMTGRVAAVERDGSKRVTVALPRDTLVVRETVSTAAGGTLRVARTGSDTGYAVRLGGASLPSAVETLGAPGSPADAGTTLVGDDALKDLAEPGGPPAEVRMFASVFLMRPETYRDQPAAVVLDCSAVTCDGEAVEDTIALNPGRPIWVEGDLLLDGSGDIGSSAAPVTIVVTGELDFDTGGRTVYGLIYGRAADWRLAGTARVEGALIAENNLIVETAAGSTIDYDADVVRRLSTLAGSFARLPGAWKDFP
ncbi:PilX N-terminal domain-containing pilus assembly protein [Rubrivivax gelatinosus]|uniref:Tfp pilus assembly protein PilX n=1 Tax=Rubrivivax gelatinosus TaxID=28068 RepID=A0A4R2LV54_RUBGE|nr:PilX N-terminal domain-containing pilus assembly protein [Rubrivivax gelatinosus]MBK1689256.1 fimbrial assembly protein [Rubrivivax gelatinosus]TCO98408.1 Tfp pilus assembly protein PilX [Rubrivivax gelatinosus]